MVPKCRDSHWSMKPRTAAGCSKCTARSWWTTLRYLLGWFRKSVRDSNPRKSRLFVANLIASWISATRSSSRTPAAASLAETVAVDIWKLRWRILGLNNTIKAWCAPSRYRATRWSFGEGQGTPETDNRCLSALWCVFSQHHWRGEIKDHPSSK